MGDYLSQEARLVEAGFEQDESHFCLIVADAGVTVSPVTVGG